MGLISRVSSRTYRFSRQTVVTKNPTMKYVAAYLLAAINNESPSKSDVKKILDSIESDIDQAQFDKVFSELDGKNVDEVVAEGMGLLASVPSGGGAAAGGAAAAGGDAGAAEAPKEEEKKEESEEESDSDMGFDLFG